MLMVGHGPHRRPGRRRGRIPVPVPYADFVTTTTHKTLRGPRGGMILCRRSIRQGPRQHDLPRHPGRAADARHRRQGGGLQGGAAAGVQGLLSSRSSSNAKALAEALIARRLPPGLRRHRQPPDAGRLLRHRAHRQGGRRGPRTRPASPSTRTPSPSIPQSPFVTSGIRIGTPAITTRGLGEGEMKQVAAWIDRALRNVGNHDELAKIRGEVRELCQRFPLYAHRLV